MRRFILCRAMVYSTALLVLSGCGYFGPGQPDTGQAATGQSSSTDSDQTLKTTKAPDSPISAQSADNQSSIDDLNQPQRASDEPGHAVSTGAHADAGFTMSTDIYDAGSVEFVPHTGPEKFASYLAMNIPFGPIERLRQQLETTLNVTLKHRGEAHITVVTPPEFERLSSNISIQEINSIASNYIQQQDFTIECLGESRMTINGEIARTFFLVVGSEDLVAMRKKIAQAYQTSGGAIPAFLAGYFPHITVGFTHRDLHDSDGAVKNLLSCIESVTSH